MARAAGTIAPGAKGEGGISLLELSDSKRVSTNEVGGLLKKGGLSGTSFQEAALLCVISAFLCASAVNCFNDSFTTEAQRKAEITERKNAQRRLDNSVTASLDYAFC